MAKIMEEKLTPFLGEKRAAHVAALYAPATLFSLSENELIKVGFTPKVAQTFIAIRDLTDIGKDKLFASGISSPQDAADYYIPVMKYLDHEELHVILLSTRNKVIDTVPLYSGSVNSSQIRIGEVFRSAIRQNAAAIILVHNHPSGDPTPSPDDVALTRAVKQAGTLLDIDFLDHIVIGHDRFVSLKERGLGFS